MKRSSRVLLSVLAFALGCSTPPPPPEVGPEISVTLPGGVPLFLVKIPEGTFSMGSPDGERSGDTDERPQHKVTLSEFYMGKYEVTQAQWQAVMGSNPSTGYGEGPNYPAYNVTWNDIASGTESFVAKLNAHLSSSGQEGVGKFRLPTEAEWEYAARGGKKTRYSFGDALSCDDNCVPCPLADQYMWWCANASNTGHPVGQKTANPYGLFDIHGNVWELVGDWYGPYSSEEQTNPKGPSSGSERVARGGYWLYDAFYCRSADRGTYDPTGGGGAVGFRIARTQ